jgi:hypothetical protein
MSQLFSIVKKGLFGSAAALLVGGAAVGSAPAIASSIVAATVASIARVVVLTVLSSIWMRFAS